MTEKEFLENITYSTNEHKQEMTIWYLSQILNTIDFSEYPEKLEDDSYCTNLTEEIALQSGLFEILVENDK